MNDAKIYLSYLKNKKRYPLREKNALRRRRIKNLVSDSCYDIIKCDITVSPYLFPVIFYFTRIEKKKFINAKPNDNTSSDR
ncbi:hypothetical protein ACH3XW_32910 [Acanthocheilonema viteae]